MKQRLALPLCLLLAFAAGQCALAEDGEFYVNTYRSVGSVAPMGGRSVAMGRSGRGLADGVASLGVNPAALGAFTGTSVDAGLGIDWLDDGADGSDQVTFKLGGAVNLDRWSRTQGANQAVGALIHTQNFSGAANLDMKRAQTGVLAGYGLQVADDLLAGVSVALFDGSWDSTPAVAAAGTSTMQRSFTGGDFRLGAIYRLAEETTVGGTLGYAIGSLRDKGEYAVNAEAGSGELKRWNIGVGVAHQYAEQTLILADLWYDNMRTDIPGALQESNRSWGVSVGVEQQVLPEVLALRGGVYYDKNSYSGGNDTVSFVAGDAFSKGRFGLTAGVGVKLYNFDLGYSLDINSGGTVKNLLDFSTAW